MPRAHRIDIGGEIYHCLNRANARIPIFENDRDYQLFETTLAEAKEKVAIDILAYIIMPNHWHLVVQPTDDGNLAKFMNWLTMTHTQRHHALHSTTGSGHIYQGRYKSFLVQSDEHFLQVCRYVERNPVRAKLVQKAEDYPWGSYWRRECGEPRHKKLLSPWHTAMPDDYTDWVNEPEDNNVLKDIRYSIQKGKPFGEDDWVTKKVEEHDLESTMKERGRPKKGS